MIPGRMWPPFRPLDPPDLLSVMHALEEAGMSYKLVSKFEDGARVYRAVVYDPTWPAPYGSLPIAWEAAPNRALAKAWMLTVRHLRRAELAQRHAQAAAAGQGRPQTPGFTDHTMDAKRRLLKTAERAAGRKGDVAAEALVELPVIAAELLEYLVQEPVGAYMVVGDMDVSALETFKRSRRAG